LVALVGLSGSPQQGAAIAAVDGPLLLTLEKKNAAQRAAFSCLMRDSS
jgi:hypothetical protein